MPFWSCYYHIVWSTYRRQPTILPQYETLIAEKIREKSLALKCSVHAINMMPDHVHVAVSIRPAISISTWVQHAKGSSAYDIQRDFDLPFKWQKSYGVLTFGRTNLDFVIAYIDKQKHHHAQHTIHPRLEKDDGFDDG